MSGTVYSFRITQEDFDIWKDLENDSDLFRIPEADINAIRQIISKPNYWFYVSRSEDKNVGGTIVHLIPETKSAVVDRIILPKNNIGIGKITIRGSLPWFGTKQLQSINAIIMEQDDLPDLKYPIHIAIPQITKDFLLDQGFLIQSTLYFVELDITKSYDIEPESFFENVSDDDLDLIELKIKRKKYPYELIGITGIMHEPSKTHILYQVGEDILGVFAVRRDAREIIEFATPINEKYAKTLVDTMISYGQKNNLEKITIIYVSEHDKSLLKYLQELNAKIIPTQWLKKEL